MTRVPFAHDVTLVFPAGADEREPGALITAGLCGHWEHDGPCPLAAHHTAATRAGDELTLRVLFACEPGDEAEVRQRITAAAAARWPVRAEGASRVTAAEADHAGRLTRS